MMEGSISKYNGLLLLTPSTNPMELFFLVLLWLALTYHPFFPLDFCNDSDLHRNFSSISHGSETVTIFLFHALVSTDEHIIQKRGAFFYHFRQSVY